VLKEAWGNPKEAQFFPGPVGDVQTHGRRHGVTNHPCPRNIDNIQLFSILHSMRRGLAPHIIVITWLALLLCGWTTGDRIIDLVFEEPDVTVGTRATADEPDNAAEHVLMPSQQATSSAADAVTTAPDLGGFSLAERRTDRTVLEATPPHYPPPPNTPVSFPIPLRI
jgi:hypothetical protein